VLAVGPGLGRGFILSYDMVFVPDPPISAADLGLTGGPARAVPSDLIVALTAKIIPAEIIEKLILILIFALACSGAAALLSAAWRPRAGGTTPAGASTPASAATPAGTIPAGNTRLLSLSGFVAGVFYAWNPFIAERLIMGQWAMLLGYAGLPWVARELLARDGRIRYGRLALAMLPATVGGFAAISITAVAALPIALCSGTNWSDRRRRTLGTLAVLVIASLPWVIPSLLVPVHADPNGATAFAARADTPFGAIGSLLLLSGIWNAQAVPAGYGGGPGSVAWLAVVAAALAGYLLAARPRRACAGLGVAAGAGFVIAALGTWPPTLAVLRDAIAFWPAFALLRDGQQFIAPLALAESVGLGAGVLALMTAGRPAPSVAQSGNLRTEAAPAGLTMTTATAISPPPPDTPARTPDTPARTPDTPARTPHTPARTPDIPARTPDIPAMGHRRGSRPLGHPFDGPAKGLWHRQWVIEGARDRRATAGKRRGPSAKIGRPNPVARTNAAGVVLSVLAMLAPVVLLPGLAWGAVGRLRSVEYPADWQQARQVIQSSPAPGSVLLLPWAQYRRYPWNHGEPVFDPWPRLLAQSVVWNDALQVGQVTVAAESPEARRLGPAITSGRPLTATLRAAGVTYVIVDAGPLLGRPRAQLDRLTGLPGAQVLLASRDLILFRLPG
jgi:hypothetical protein